MATKPNLCLIPSGYKASKVYSVLPSDGVGDFTFARDTIATRINKDGLIETVDVDVPRLNYPLIDGVVSGCPSLLLEPSRSNLVRNSEDLTQWTNYNANAVLSEETIYGKNAYKIVEDSTVNYHGIYLTNLFAADNTNYIWSVYVKGAERRYVVLTSRVGISSNESALIFDTQDGVWVLNNSGQNQALSAESVGNGWWRISMEGDPTSGAYDSYTIASAIGFSSYLDANYQGDGISGIYVAMPQVEQGSYATSYIPTQGSIGTRVAETCEQTPPDGIIGQTEGSIYTELNMSNIGGNFIFSIDDGGASDFIILDTNSIGELYLQVRQSSGSITTIISGSALIEGSNKIAIRYKSGDYSFYLNGVLQGTSTSTLFPSGTISRVSVGANSSYGFLSNSVNDFKLYDTALTNTELQALTKI